MTDEKLIARLRENNGLAMLGPYVHLTAADRIEALGAEVARLERELDYMAREADMNEEEACAVENDLLEAEAYARELEAKLAKAVEGLTLIERAYYQESTNPSPATIRRMAARMNGIARETQDALAELTGGKDE